MQQTNQIETETTRQFPAVRRSKTPTVVGDLAAHADLLAKPEPPDTTVVVGLFSRPPRAETEPAADVDRPEEPSGRDKLAVELFSYARLPEGWDGYDGVPASTAAIVDALNFLESVPRDIPLPYAQIASDGEVGLYWRTDEVHAEVGFYGDGEFSHYARHAPAGGEVAEHGRDGCGVDDGLPEELLLVLNKLAR